MSQTGRSRGGKEKQRRGRGDSAGTDSPSLHPLPKKQHDNISERLEKNLFKKKKRKSSYMPVDLQGGYQ